MCVIACSGSCVLWKSEGNSLNYVQSGFSQKFNVLMKENMVGHVAAIVVSVHFTAHTKVFRKPCTLHTIHDHFNGNKS